MGLAEDGLVSGGGECKGGDGGEELYSCSGSNPGLLSGIFSSISSLNLTLFTHALAKLPPRCLPPETMIPWVPLQPICVSELLRKLDRVGAWHCQIGSSDTVEPRAPAESATVTEMASLCKATTCTRVRALLLFLLSVIVWDAGDLKLLACCCVVGGGGCGVGLLGG